MEIRITDSLAYHVYRSARLLRRHFLGMATGIDMELTQEQWFVLNKLMQEDGQSQVELGEDIFADRPNLTRILVTMERRGLVRRRPDDEDGRKIRVFLTADGRRHHDRFAAIVPEARGTLFDGITKKDLETAIRVLARLESNIAKGA